MLIFASATPDIGRYQEYKRGIEKFASWFDPALEIGDGFMSVPDGPGTGVTEIQMIIEGAEPRR
jgi:L-alanine-DL-glutamate epimerase-like enolase superfamily enzyme